MPEISDFEHEPEEKQTTGEGWAVVLFNDEVNQVKRVTATLMEVVQIPMDVAIEATLRAECHGQTIVTITTERQANEIVERLQAARMNVELQPF